MKLGAKWSHVLLYVLMITMPLLGLGMLWTGYPVVLYGGIVIPALLPQSDLGHTLLWTAHVFLGLAFFALVMLHVAAALFHALIRRDGVFAAMSPLPRRGPDDPPRKTPPRRSCEARHLGQLRQARRQATFPAPVLRRMFPFMISA